MSFLVTFIILSIINVVFSTIRTLTTVKSGKTIASLISGGYFAFYNVMLIWTVADFPLWQKCLITFCCNVIGVWVVKFIEERMTKDKLWKVEATVHEFQLSSICKLLDEIKVPYNYILSSGDYAIINLFCSTQKESTLAKEILERFDAKYFVSESKVL